MAFVPGKGEIVFMEINVRVQKPVKQEKIVWFHAKQALYKENGRITGAGG